MALRLARYFGTSPDVWIGLQADYELYWARMKSKKAMDEIKPHIKSKAARSQERSTGISGAGNYRYGKKSQNRKPLVCFFPKYSLPHNQGRRLKKINKILDKLKHREIYFNQ